jgi:UDP-N-acetyl-D-mannosaminuronic acid dehydrogenase
VDDLRESPATEVVHLLQKEGAQVKTWEPFKPDAKLVGINMADDLGTAIKDADLILLLVKHTEFAAFKAGEIASQTKARIAVDTVNAWKIDEWQRAGFQFHRLGDNKSPVKS